MMTKEKLQELPYERIAMAGGEMPDGLTATDQNMFLSLRLVYDSYKKGIINREAAYREKNRLLIEYKASLILDAVCLGWAEQIKKTEAARQAYRKNRTLENADAIILAMEGMPVTNNMEAL
jgi:hypothetical protein